jgi:hypothetical protein
MRLVFAPRGHGRIELGIIYGSIALLLLLAARFLPLLAIAPDCTFRLLTGFPCPTCGSTRSLVHLAHGDLLSAAALNPLAFASFVVAVLALLYGLAAVVFRFPRASLALSEGEERIFRVFCLLMLVANWMYLLRTL